MAAVMSKTTKPATVPLRPTAAAQGALPQADQERRVTIILHSGELDKVYSAFIIANGNLAMGWEASIYFTFWGLLRLRKGQLAKGPLSKFNLLGIGARGMRWQMRRKGVQPLEDLARDFKALGGKIIACDLTIDVMGIKKEKLDTSIIDSYGAVGTWWADASKGGITLFL